MHLLVQTCGQDFPQITILHIHQTLLPYSGKFPNRFYIQIIWTTYNQTKTKPIQKFPAWLKGSTRLPRSLWHVNSSLTEASHARNTRGNLQPSTWQRIFLNVSKTWPLEMGQLGWPGPPRFLGKIFAYTNFELPWALTRLYRRCRHKQCIILCERRSLADSPNPPLIWNTST